MTSAVGGMGVASATGAEVAVANPSQAVSAKANINIREKKFSFH
jgi:hypothetical protein